MDNHQQHHPDPQPNSNTEVQLWGLTSAQAQFLINLREDILKRNAYSVLDWAGGNTHQVAAANAADRAQLQLMDQLLASVRIIDVPTSNTFNQSQQEN